MHGLNEFARIVAHAVFEDGFHFLDVFDFVCRVAVQDDKIRSLALGIVPMVASSPRYLAPFWVAI